MIRLIQRRLIIPRGDTGTFSVPVLSSYNSGDAAVFSIIDPKTQRRVYNKLMYVTDSVISVRFEHGDTVNLPVGKFLWDIKFYQDPIIDEGQVVDGKEVDSYYAAFTMPECEVRQTGDNMLTADDAPGSTLTPQQVNAINAALLALNEAVEKTETNVMHYPTIIDGVWNVWDANLEGYTTTGVEATGNGIASIEKTNTEGLVDTYTVNFTDGTAFLYDITNGDRGVGISSISKGSASGLVDTYIIAYTDGTSTTFTITNGATPNITIGTVQEGSIAAASITGSTANPVLNLTLPNANVPTRVSELENDAGYLTSETDPTVPQWAKAPTKPSYTAQEVGALPDDTFIPIKVSDLQDDSGHYIKPANGIPASDLEETYLTSFTETDPTVPQWAKQSTKPAYTAQEVGALPVDTYIPEKTSDLVNDSNYAVDANYVHTDNNYTTAEKEKLSGIAVGAEVNVNADWNAVSGDAQILNKPTRLSAFLNDEGYLTEHQDISGKQDKLTFDSTPTANSINPVTSGGVYNAIANINTMNIHICAQGEYNAETGIPTIQNPDTSTFYLVPGGEGSNLFIEWAYVNSAWEQFGSADVDLSDYVQKTDYATSTTAGVIKVNNYGLQMIDNGDRLALQPATIAQIKGQASNYLPIVPTTQHAAVFYGLATAAGDSSQVVSNNEVGTYTNNAKTAIQTMLNVPAKEDVPIKVSDLTNDAGYLTQHQDISEKANSADLAAVATSGNYNDLNNTPSIPTKISDLTDDSGHYTKPSNGIPKTDLTSDVQTSLGKADTALQSAPVTSVNNKTGAVTLTAVDVGAGTYSKPSGGIPKTDLASGVQNSLDAADSAYQKPMTGIPASDIESGVIPNVPVQDVQVNGTSVLSNGVANIPLTSTNVFGAVKIGAGLRVSNGLIWTDMSASSDVKTGTSNYTSLSPSKQHESVFYGLAKAAGDTTQSQSSNAVGTYTDAAKSAISTMLNSTVTVTGSTPTITALPGVQYVCGEVATISITPPASGITDVVFTSGSTAAVLTVPNTVKWPAWFDPTTLDANTTYEINIMDGVYGAVGVWT